MQRAAELTRALVFSAALTLGVSPPACPQEHPGGASDVSSTPVALKFSVYQGRKVRDIQFRGVEADPLTMNHLRDLLAQKVDEPLDGRKVKRSIQQLFATGRFANIQVDAQQQPDAQVSLVFIAEENQFIGSLTVEGEPKRPTANQLVDATKLDLGERYTPEKLNIALAQMKSVLADNGYYQADIAVEKTSRPEVQQIELHFKVKPGKQALIGQVMVYGSPGYSAAQVRKISGLEPRHAVAFDRVTRALQRLRKKYQKQRRLEAQIAMTDRLYHAPSNTVDYVLNVVRGPVVELQVEGAGLTHGQLKKFIPIYEENAVDDDLLNEGRRNLRQYFQTLGFFDAEVNFQREPVPEKDLLRIIYIIDRGARHKLTDVFIEGNKYLQTEDLRDTMQVQPAGFLLSHGRYSQDLLARDVDSLEAQYHNNGFQQVKVTAEVADDYKGEKNRMAVFVRINEGPQTRVGKLTVTGNSSIPDTQLPLLATEEGQPYSEANVALDRDAVLNYYFNNGFPDVQFEVSSQPEPANPNLMDVTYTIKEGDRVFVDRVLSNGLHFTHPWVVDRELEVHPGNPLSQISMLDSQRRLYNLGIFNEVEAVVQNPEGRARYKDVLFNFQEAKRWTFNYGGGLEIQTGPTSSSPQGEVGVSPRVSFDLSRINFRGRDHTLTLHSHVGRLQQRGLVSYDAPRWFNLPNLRLTFTALYDNSINVQTFTSERLEGSVQAEQALTRRADGQPVSTLLLRFNYRRVRASNLSITPELIAPLSQPVRVGIPSLTYIRDKRDDPLDSHKGNYTTFDAGYAASALGSEASFGRMLVQNATYQPFGRRGRFVFARNTRLGVEEPTGSTTIIPLAERFLAGGGYTLRGFGLNQAGPRDLNTGFPLGGGAMFINNLELRLPPVLLPYVQDNVSFVVFHDFGNVFKSATDMFDNFLQWTQKDKASCRSTDPAATCDFNFMSHAVGGGVRYRTPIGPVRVDFGYNLNPPTYPVKAPAKGDPNQTPRYNVLGRFNFFFSIGQTF